MKTRLDVESARRRTYAGYYDDPHAIAERMHRAVAVLELANRDLQRALVHASDRLAVTSMHGQWAR